MRTESRHRAAAKAFVERALRDILKQTSGQIRQALAQLIYTVRARSQLLRAERLGSTCDLADPSWIMRGLTALAHHHEQWIRPLDDWAAQGAGRYAVFASLADHLFVRYPMPAFMTDVWFAGTNARALNHQRWFLHLGRGGSIRTAGLPIHFTRAMGHHFCRAPMMLRINRALRWAQVKGLGGSDALAKAVCNTWLSYDFNHDAFWTSVIQFFVNQPRLELAQVGPIIDFLSEQKYETRQLCAGNATFQECGPPNPNLEMKGRTVKSLLRAMAVWKEQRRRETRRGFVRWRPIGISGFRLVEFEPRERTTRTWTIEELLNSHELRSEGRAMRHCVADYDSACAGRTSAIWSMRVEDQNGKRRAVTIEVDPPRRSIVQASQRANADPTPRQREIMAAWAQKEGLKIEC
jgi:hypothetical protein